MNPRAALESLDLPRLSGWLYLLLTQLLLIGPFLSVVLTSAYLSQGEDLNAQSIDPHWKLTKYIVSILVAAGVLGNFISGVRLAIFRERKTLYDAVAALWIFGPFLGIFGTLVVAFNAPIYAPFPAIAPVSTVSVFASAIAAYGWTCYLCRSKRVLEIYNVDLHRSIERRKGDDSPRGPLWRSLTDIATSRGALASVILLLAGVVVVTLWSPGVSSRASFRNFTLASEWLKVQQTQCGITRTFDARQSLTLDQFYRDGYPDQGADWTTQIVCYTNFQLYKSGICFSLAGLFAWRFSSRSRNLRMAD